MSETVPAGERDLVQATCGICNGTGCNHCDGFGYFSRPARLVAEPAVLDDTSLRARIGEIGNQIHNVACEHQNDEALVDRLSALRGELWALAKQAPALPTAEADELRAAMESLRADIADDVRYLSDIKRTFYGDGSLDAKKGVLAALDKALASSPSARTNAKDEE